MEKAGVGREPVQAGTGSRPHLGFPRTPGGSATYAAFQYVHPTALRTLTPGALERAGMPLAPATDTEKPQALAVTGAPPSPPLPSPRRPLALPHHLCNLGANENKHTPSHRQNDGGNIRTAPPNPSSPGTEATMVEAEDPEAVAAAGGGGARDEPRTRQPDTCDDPDDDLPEDDATPAPAETAYSALLRRKRRAFGIGGGSGGDFGFGGPVDPLEEPSLLSVAVVSRDATTTTKTTTTTTTPDEPRSDGDESCMENLDDDDHDDEEEEEEEVEMDLTDLGCDGATSAAAATPAGSTSAEPADDDEDASLLSEPRMPTTNPEDRLASPGRQPEPSVLGAGADDEASRQRSPAVAVQDSSAGGGSEAPVAVPPVPPSLEDVLSRVEESFREVPDPLQVTVRQVLESVERRCKCALDKSLKAAARARLAELVAQRQQRNDDDDDGASSDDERSSGAENETVASESERDDGEEDASVGSEDGTDDDDDEYTSKRPRSATRKKKQTNKNQAKKAKSSSAKASEDSKKKQRSSDPQRPRRPPKADARVKALRLHAEALRKRRLEELRVRNEELMLEEKHQKDRKRAEEIAAKFDTNTDELRLQRLEQRIDLLSKLDEKRLTVVQKETVVELVESPSEDSSDDSGDDEDDDLEVEGGPPSAVLAPRVRSRDAVTLLDLADHRACRQHLRATLRPSSASPSRGLKARAALRNALLQRRRQQSNLWLARELGYKSEKEHLKDCLEVEQRKQALILQRERDRLERNKRLRERLLEGVELEDQGPDDLEGEGGEAAAATDAASDPPPAAEEDEEDEEMAMARELEQQEPGSLDPESSSSSACRSSDDASLGENSPSSGAPAVESPAAMDDVNHDDDQVIDSDCGPSVESEDPESLIHNVTPAASSPTSDVEGGGEGEGAADGDEESEIRSVSDPESHPSEAPAAAVVKPQGPRNAAWKALLEKDAAQAKKMKARKSGLVEDEADEEEDEQQAGLEDFGFTVHKKKKEDEENDDDFNEDDLKHVVDELSDDEGDEDAGERARKALEKQEEKERHKEILRRMRDGYDGRRGGIASGGFGARGVHRFDELVAADNREDAKRLGLLNDDELESDGEESGEKKAGGDDEEEDEAALLDKMLKDRFLHRSSVEIEENFSDDDEESADEAGDTQGQDEDAEDREQERLAKRFAKRARMQRLLDAHAHDEEFSQSKLIDEDASLKAELQKMKNGLERKRSSSSQSSSTSSVGPAKKLRSVAFASGFLPGGSLAIALQASNRNKAKTSFLKSGCSGASNDMPSSFQKGHSFSHSIFANSNSSLGSTFRAKATSKLPSSGGRPMPRPLKSSSSSSLWSRAVGPTVHKTR